MDEDILIGMSEASAIEIEEEIVSFKMSKLNMLFTFNVKEYNLEYFKRLNKFLFGDIYADAGVVTNGNQNDLDTISNLIKKLDSQIFNQAHPNDIRMTMRDLIDLQVFSVGNNRTVASLAKIMIDAHRIVNKEYYDFLLSELMSSGLIR